MADILYWKTRRYAIGYTPHRQPDGKFYALKYHTKVVGSGRLVKKVAFGRRKVARERAYKWYQQAKAKEKTPAPPKPKAKPTDEDKLRKVQTRIKATQTKLKRLTTHLKKLKRTEKYYQKKILREKK
jgi:putative cell wall-binding protein